MPRKKPSESATKRRRSAPRDQLGNEAERSRGILMGDGCDEAGESVTVGKAERVCYAFS